MYTQWFNLEQLPFRLRPDPSFLYVAGETATQYESLLEAVRTGSGPVFITGDTGVGKSTLIRAATTGAGGSVSIAHLLQPNLTLNEMYDALFEQFGLEPTTESRAARRRALDAHIAERRRDGQRALIVADDAHLFTPEALNELRAMCGTGHNWNMILVGEPELTVNLRAAGPGFEQSGGVNIHIQPLNEARTGQYIRYRLRLAGAGARELFANDAIETIYRYTGGIPRKIHMLCDSALLNAESRKGARVEVRDVLDAARDLKWGEPRIAAPAPPGDPPAATPRRKPPARPVAVPHTPRPDQLEVYPKQTATVTLCYRGQKLGSTTVEKGTLLIGRGTDCGVQIESMYVSRRHCRILTDDQGSQIEDLGSANRLMVNGRITERCDLVDGDLITVGKHILLFRAGALRH
jgi:type II secretory pathway predicted ATPase ExeA